YGRCRRLGRKPGVGGWCQVACHDGLDHHFLSSASRCLTNLSSSSVCCATRSAFRASSPAPENAAACSTSWRMLSRTIAMRCSSSESEGERPLLMMFFPRSMTHKPNQPAQVHSFDLDVRRMDDLTPFGRLLA